MLNCFKMDVPDVSFNSMSVAVHQLGNWVFLLCQWNEGMCGCIELSGWDVFFQLDLMLNLRLGGVTFLSGRSVNHTEWMDFKGDSWACRFQPCFHSASGRDILLLEIVI